MKLAIIDNYFKKNIAKKLFFGFLIFYSIILIYGIFSGKIAKTCVSDECVYFENAFNLLNGEYQDPLTSRLVSPGFSLVILPLIFLELGRISIVFLNIIFGSLTVLLTYLTSKYYLSKKSSFLAAVIWGFYYIQYEQLFGALTEPISAFLIILSCYIVHNLNYHKSKINILLLGLTLGLLNLIKPIFLYVIILLIILNFIYLLFNKKSFSLLLSLILAFSITIPYQAYTYSKTGKILFLSNISGESLYWMSTPYEGEMGNWNNDKFDANCIEEQTGYFVSNPDGFYCNKLILEKNHGKFFKSLEGYDMVQRNEALINKAKNNIITNPFKYFRNIINNISRMFFNIPNSFFFQREITIFRIIPNSILFTLIVFSSFLTLSNLKKLIKLKKEMIFSVIFIFTYLSLSSLVSAYARMLTIAVPFIIIWSMFCLKFWRNGYIINQKVQK